MCIMVVKYSGLNSLYIKVKKVLQNSNIPIMSCDLDTLLDELLDIKWMCKRDAFNSAMISALNNIETMQLDHMAADKLRVCTMTIHITSSLSAIDIQEVKHLLITSDISTVLSKETEINDTNSFYNSVTLKLKEGKKKYAIKLFKNGSFHLTGFVNITDATDAVNKLLGILDPAASIMDFNVQMINTCVKIRSMLNIPAAQDVFKRTFLGVYYDTERHPGLKVLVPTSERNVTCIIFRTGNVLLTGIKDPLSLWLAYSTIMKLLDNNHLGVLCDNTAEPQRKRPRREVKSFDYLKYVS